MGDIDFEEIDRAVNSLIAKTPSDGIVPVDNTQPVAEPVVTVTASEPVVAVEQQLLTTPPANSAPAQPLVSQRSSGRFMDMIHPSADMRPTGQPLPNGQAINPDSNLSMSEIRNIANPNPPQPPVLSSIDSADQSIESKPLDNPFISGAKVEKRPLGNYSQLVSEVPAGESPQSGEVGDDNQPEPVVTDSDNSSIGLPDELKNDILQVESGNQTSNTEPIKIEEVDPVEQPKATPYIVQQYKETPAEANKPNPIYDTNVYHKAIDVSGKKKSGWLWVLWIVLLVILGAGTGALAYFYILPLF